MHLVGWSLYGFKDDEQVGVPPPSALSLVLSLPCTLLLLRPLMCPFGFSIDLLIKFVPHRP
jgi:hypothetical protein